MRVSIILSIFSALVGTPQMAGAEPHLALSQKGPLNTASSKGPNLLSAWSAWGPQSQFWVRAVSDSTECPTLVVDSSPVSMTARPNRNPNLFPILLCEAEVSRTARKIRLENRSIPAPNLKPKKIVIIGDTGCQIQSKAGKMEIQNCNSSKKWPFEKIAKAAADWGPDLFIHVGDYHYREANCPPNESECEGSFSGDNWASWKQDFFDPAESLLREAPGIFVRGNHEECARAGNGFFYLLDPRSTPTRCLDQTDPYFVPFGNDLLFSVIDSANPAHMTPSLGRVLDTLKPGMHSWLLLHRPFLSEGTDADVPALPSALISSLKSGKINGVIAGHQHLFNFNQFTDQRPPEIIVGNSGAKLEKATKDLPPEWTFQRSEEQSSALYPTFGFATLEIKDSHWTVSVRDTEGSEIGTCQSVQNSTCSKPNSGEGPVAQCEATSKKSLRALRQNLGIRLSH